MTNNKTKVVFISGMFAGGWIWDRMLEVFPSDRYEIVLQEEPLGAIGQSVSELARQIHHNYFADHDGKVILVGNSLGGLLALKLAVTHKEQVTGIVMSGSPGMGSTNLGIGIPRTNKLWLQQLVKKLFVNQGAVTDEELNRIVDFFQDRANVKNVLRLTRETNHYQVTEELKQVHCPTYLLWGSDDQITPVDAWQRKLDQFDNCYLHTFQQCGHSPMVEKPEEFSLYLQNIINRLSMVSSHD